MCDVNPVERAFELRSANPGGSGRSLNVVAADCQKVDSPGVELRYNGGQRGKNPIVRALRMLPRKYGSKEVCHCGSESLRSLTMHISVQAVNRPDVPAFKVSPRFRHDITYFAAHPSDLGRPTLPQGEYYIQLAAARVTLDDGVFRIVSPLDSDNRTELEITEEQEDWLKWIVEYEVEHVRLVS